MDLGYTEIMGAKLREEVTRQLTVDLAVYGFQPKALSFDWSETCIEGHRECWMDGELENFSGIDVLLNGEPFASGWMDFVVDDEVLPPRLFVYWEFLRVLDQDLKTNPGIPIHIWNLLSQKTQEKYSGHREAHRKLP